MNPFIVQNIITKMEYLSLAGKLEGIAKTLEDNSDIEFTVKKLREMSQEIQIKVADMDNNLLK